MDNLNSVVLLILKLGLCLVLFIGGIVVFGIIFSKIMNKGFSLSDKLEKIMSKGKNIDPFWPNFNDKETAIIVAKNSSYCVFLFSILIIIFTAFHIFGDSNLRYIDAAILLIIGYGLFKMSRTAAISGLVLFILGKVYFLLTHYFIFNTVWVILVFLIYINGIRATFAYHKLELEADETKK